MAGDGSFFEKVDSVNPKAAASLYAQLRYSIREAIDQQRLLPQETLPAEREISSRMAISRITVRKAISGLVEEGLLVRQQGSGTFVASRVEKQFSLLSSFSEDMAARGRIVRSEWLGQETGVANTDEMLALGLSPGSTVFRFSRVRYADDQAMAVEYSTIAGFALVEAKQVEDSLYDALQKTGNRPVRALQRLRAVLFEAKQAKLLGIDAGAPALLIERRGFNQSGAMVEQTRSWYRGDAYDFVAEINGK